MGDKLRTIQNLEIVKSDPENNLIFVKGSVPGSKNSIILVQKNKKKINKITTLEKNKKIIEKIAQPESKDKEKKQTKKENPAQKTDNKTKEKKK